MTMLRRPNTTPDRSAPTVPHFALVNSEVDEQTNAISVEGELDLSTAPRLKWMLLDAVEAGCKQLVVDLSLVTFMDSTALAVLVGLSRALDSDTRLGIVCTSEKVLQVFEFSGTDKAFSIHPTLEQALDYVRGQLTAGG